MPCSRPTRPGRAGLERRGHGPRSRTSAPGGAGQEGGRRRAGGRAQRGSERLGEDERAAAARADELLEQRRTGLLYLPNIRRRTRRTARARTTTWKSAGGGRAGRRAAAAQKGGTPGGPALGDRRVAADPRHGTRRRLAGSMFPLYRGPGARLLRALTAFAIDRHSPAYEEIRPPTVVLTETMTSTGHLPKFSDDAYHVERDDLWLIRRPRCRSPPCTAGTFWRSRSSRWLHRGDGLLPA